jgi:hypothetical protein
MLSNEQKAAMNYGGAAIVIILLSYIYIGVIHFG